MSEDHVRLSIPARHEYARIARIGVAALALRLGFTYREIEDLRLAVDETLIFLLGIDRPGERVTIHYGTEAGILSLVAVTDFDHPPSDEARERFESLIVDLVDSWEIGEHGKVSLLKRHQG